MGAMVYPNNVQLQKGRQEAEDRQTQHSLGQEA